MPEENNDKEKKEPVSPLNIEEQGFDDVMKRIVRVPRTEKEKSE
jgi:hypothetical protein